MLKEQLKLTSPIPVSVNHYLCPRAFIQSVNGKPKAMVTIFETKDAKDYKKLFTMTVLREMKNQKWTHVPNKTQHFYVEADFYFPRIDMDSNNHWKLILDSISDAQCIWLDDNVVCERVKSIRYDAKNPRIELTITKVDYIGVFDTQDEFDIFEVKCKMCKRYKNNCSILLKAIEGRIQDDIVLNESGGKECVKFKMDKSV